MLDSAVGNSGNTGTRFKSGYTSPLKGVSDAAWEKFVYALNVQPIDAVSESGGLGCFDLRPRRLVELGIMENLRYERRGKHVTQVGAFIAPQTKDLFLTNPMAQYEVLVRSMKAYDEDLSSGVIAKPAYAGRSGTLVVLHRGGRGALKKWPKVFSHTAKIYHAAKSLF